MLTVRQPWASQIIVGTKTREHRSWATSHRGWLWIHAARQLGDPAGAGLPLGVILGRVWLLDVVPGTAPGYKWDFVLGEPQALAEPFPAKGRLYLWPAPVELAGARCVATDDGCHMVATEGSE